LTFHTLLSDQLDYINHPKTRFPNKQQSSGDAIVLPVVGGPLFAHSSDKSVFQIFANQ